jgi:hypothetical protein
VWRTRWLPVGASTELQSRSAVALASGAAAQAASRSTQARDRQTRIIGGLAFLFFEPRDHTGASRVAAGESTVDARVASA